MLRLGHMHFSLRNTDKTVEINPIHSHRYDAIVDTHFDTRQCFNKGDLWAVHLCMRESIIGHYGDSNRFYCV